MSQSRVVRKVNNHLWLINYFLGFLLVVPIWTVYFLPSKYTVQNLSSLLSYWALVVLIWYAWETRKMANEIVAQTELQTMPILCLYVRYVAGVNNPTERQSIKEKYSITHQIQNAIVPSSYYLAVRNVGNGSAFNVELESGKFVGWKYQTKFFAPKGDEHAIGIVKKPSHKIRNLSELTNEVFVIRCQSFSGKIYEYKYKLVNVEDRVVTYLN